MKCCAFGTLRMDVQAWQDLNEINNHEEVRIDNMKMTVGGSVYNTVSVLSVMGQETDLYIPRINDEFSGNILLKTAEQNMNLIFDSRDSNDTPVTLVFIKNDGQKKMFSFDGKRQDKYILENMLEKAEQYNSFYTSFYEINDENYKEISRIMSRCETTVIDLTPLIYEVSPAVFKSILAETSVLCGTIDEFHILFDILDVRDFHSIIEQYDIKYIFVKKGSQGAAVYYGNNSKNYIPKEKKESHNTTGCGDTFNAAVLYYITRNYDIEYVLENAVEMATKVAYNGFDPHMFGIKNSHKYSIEDKTREE